MFVNELGRRWTALDGAGGEVPGGEAQSLAPSRLTVRERPLRRFPPALKRPTGMDSVRDARGHFLRPQWAPVKGPRLRGAGKPAEPTTAGHTPACVWGKTSEHVKG